MAMPAQRMRGRAYALAALGALLLILAFVLHPFAQPQSYHDFADTRGWLGIPNYGNVASNVMFLVVGLIGLAAMRAPAVRAMESAPRHAYGLMFLGLVFTAFGSAYYHWAPSDLRLVWDRLPMTVVFMPLMAATFAERLRLRSDLLLLVLTPLGVGSVVYWKYSDNLMPYLLAQGGAVLLILLAMALLPTPWTERRMLWPALLCYAVAFVSEKLDLEIFRWTTGIISGHTIKHLVAAAAFYFILRMLQRQQLKTDQDR
ncbi:ceramidase domain-containing protein [Dyella psychrodurans]|uniref:Alkaline phytoceramidase n=1 Tax=Dyella psychrodurans TaxID=1927960 RepID=A0A370XEI3_9GAMM|nr:ceramidase domain-containing protein [Dyella psychrodurans]RDS86779.1 alkaline phytoceramidase [Dyella psychrodurans]